MPEVEAPKLPLRILLGLAAFVVVIAGMRAAQEMIVPFLLAVFIAIISAPPFLWLQRHRVGTLPALALVVLAIVIIGVGTAALLGTSLDDFSTALPSYQDKLRAKTLALVGWLQQHGVDVSEQGVLNYLDPGSAMRLASNILKGLGGALTNAFLIIITVIFILLEVSTFSAKLRRAQGSPESSLEGFHRILDNIKRYMGIKTLTSALTGLLVTVGLAVVGVDFAVLWGFLAFLLNFIPNIGSFIAAVPAVLLALLQLGSASALVVALVFVIVNVAVGSVFEPRLMGSRLGLSPLVVFISLVFWGWVLGPVGMFLSVPLTMSVQIVLDSSEHSRWLAVLLGSGVPADRPAQDAEGG
jgi:predicted PurR-regulated permease PerM